jgi:predicted ATP-grasp superfamily ATP-dependent carboligase
MTDSGKIAAYLREKYGPWGWMGQRAHDAAGINRILPLDFIISCSYGTDLKHYFREEDLYSVEKHHPVRKNWSNEDLKDSLKGELGREVSRRLDRYKKAAHLVCYRSVRAIERKSGAFRKKPILYAVPESLKTRFDNKILLYRNLKKLGLARVEGMVDYPARHTFRALVKKLSLPFVVQFPYGSSGSSTFIVIEEKDFRFVKAAFPDSKAVIAKYMDGPSLNVNAVIVSSPDGARVVCMAPSVQVVGVPECCSYPSVFCGNDYSSARDLDPEMLQQVERIVQVTGKWMASSGYRGIFGMDLVSRDGTVYPVEINPRFQNSTSLHNTLVMLEGRAEEAPFLLHIAEFLQSKDTACRRFVMNYPDREAMRPLEGSQVILHNRMWRKVIKGDVAPGVYRTGGRELLFVRGGATLENCAEHGEMLITGGIPAPDTLVEPGAPMLKIQTRSNALDPVGKKRLSEDMKKTATLVYKKLALREAERADARAALKAGR